MVCCQLSKICGTSSHAPAQGGVLMGKWKRIFVTLAVKTGALIEFHDDNILGFFVSLFSANLQNSVLRNMIDNRQVENLSPSLNSIHHRGMVLVSGLVCYKYNIRGKGDPSCEIWGRKWSFNIHLTHLSSLSSQQAIHPANDDVWLQVWV